jgi:hypothetical protein
MRSSRPTPLPLPDGAAQRIEEVIAGAAVEKGVAVR